MHMARKSRLKYVTAVSKHFTRSVAVAHIITNDKIQLKSWREIPGPPSLPIIGQMHHFLPGGHLYNLDKSIATVLGETYGPIVRLETIFLSKPMIFTFDPEIASYILRNENWLPIRNGFDSLDYYRKVYNKNKDYPEDAAGLMTEQGDSWKRFRSKVNPILLQPKNVKQYSTSLKEVAEDMIERIRLIRDENNMIKETFDIEMNLFALESIGVVALGGRLNCLDPNLPEDSPARKLIKVVHNIFKTAQELDIDPSIWKFISTPAYKRGMKNYEEQAKLCKYFIEKGLQQLKTKDHTSNEGKSILEKLLEIDEKVALVMASDMLVAGVDTVANTLTATIYLLAINPEKQEKLHAEIVSGKNSSKYLKACVKESMRVMPIVMGNTRQTTKEYNIMGYRIPIDTQMLFCHQFLSLMEEHFPRAREYIPERWITEKSDPLYYGNTHPFTSSPFGFGARSCIGRRIAELEVELFLSKLIENFRVEWIGPPIKLRYAALNYTVAPYNFVFKDR